jgi:Uma2 family endonuclease
MASVDFRTRRWKRVEYERLVEGGFLQSGEPVELVGGQLMVAEPQGSWHFTGIRAVEAAVRAAFGPACDVRLQGPLALDDESEPEPDVAVVPGTFRDYALRHPSRCLLLVEVSESSLAVDRELKGSLYARAGVADYWIVNLVDRVVEVCREPGAEPTAPYGWRYRSIQVLVPGAVVFPLARPEARIQIADLLP